MAGTRLKQHFSEVAETRLKQHFLLAQTYFSYVAGTRLKQHFLTCGRNQAQTTLSHRWQEPGSNNTFSHVPGTRLRHFSYVTETRLKQHFLASDRNQAQTTFSHVAGTWLKQECCLGQVPATCEKAKIRYREGFYWH